MFDFKGKDITAGLRAFNEWRDDFLIELSTLLLLIGFVTGTVDVFTKGGISTNPLFNVAWAIVQALAIDGLFFDVWGKIARAEWTRASLFKNGMLVLVGLLLALVATLVNGILSYQELMSIPNVQSAMDRLGVAQATFTYARSILVVIVSILVALFCRSQRASEDQPAGASRVPHTQAVAQITPPVALAYRDLGVVERAMLDALRQRPGELQELVLLAQEQDLEYFTATLKSRYPQFASHITTGRVARVMEVMARSPQKRNPRPRAISEGTQGSKQDALASGERATASLALPRSSGHSPHPEEPDPALRRRAESPQDGYVAIDDGATVAIADGHGQSMFATGSHRDRIKQAMLAALQQGRQASYQDIAGAAGVGYSTVKKYAPVIRVELEQLSSEQE